MKKLCIIFMLTVLPFLSGCDLTTEDESPQANGIIIYTGREILNNRPDGKGTIDNPFEIVAKRAQQLNATSLSGGKIEWKSSNPAILEIVDQTGLIRVGQALGKTATVTASLVYNPEIKAEVTFIVRDLR